MTVQDKSLGVVTAAPGTRARPASHRLRRSAGPVERFTGSRWPLPAVLAVQAALSAHLIWANTAFQDEALYLYTGRLEWSHWLHGTPIPALATYFSGAPVLYPPLGAAAAALGGLAAARALSLCFMLGATVLLHGATRRIFGRSPAAFAAGLFAGAAATQFLGAFATYDALALALLALATWLGIRALDGLRRPHPALLVLAGLVLCAADATKYAAALFDPVVIATVTFAGWQRRGRRAGLRGGLVCGGAAAVAAGAALAAGGQAYWQGITSTTLARPPGDSAAGAILLVSLGWAGAVALASLLGAVTAACSIPDPACRWLTATLALAVWLAPAEQARISTFTSLFKHAGFGEWFGAIAGGLALASITSAVPRRKADGALRFTWIAVLAAAISGGLLATNQFASWPDSRALVSALRPLVRAGGSVLATDNADIIEYYLPQAGLQSTQFISAGAGGELTYRNPRDGRWISGPRAYDLAVRRGYFTVIALSGLPAFRGVDTTVRADIRKDADYRLAARIPYIASGHPSAYQIWVLRRSR